MNDPSLHFLKIFWLEKRTFVIPPMYRHFTDDNDPNGIVDAGVRIDIGKVRQLVSTIDFHNLPKNEVDDVLVARGLGGEGGKGSTRKFFKHPTQTFPVVNTQIHLNFEIARK